VLVNGSNRMGWALSPWSVIVLVTLGGCALPPDAPPPDEPANAVTAEPASFDLGAVMRRVHFAYRADGAGYTGGHSTYAVHVNDGTVAFTPFHHARPGELAPDGRMRVPGEAVEGAPVTFETTAIERGGAAIAAAAARTATVDTEGALAIRHRGAIECLRNGEVGVEQSWTFDRRPAGKGDVVVRVHVRGQRYRGETEHGQHFVDDATGLGVRYGTATWVDARGVRSPVAVRHVGDELVLTVPEAVLDAASYPAVLDPTIGPETGMDTAVSAAAGGAQSRPKVAGGGANLWLVVWEDARGADTDVYGARLDNTGALLGTGFVIGSGAGSQSQPAVAFDGNQFLVAWADTRNSAITGTDVYGTFVDTLGNVSDPIGFVVNAAANEQLAPAIAFQTGGTKYLVAWEDHSGATWDIRGTTVTTAGVVAASVVLINTAADEHAPAVAYNGSVYLVAWEAGPTLGLDLKGRRFNTSLANLGDLTFSTATGDQHAASVAARPGQNFLVVWEDARGSSIDVYSRTVSSAGVLGAEVVVSSAIQTQRVPSVTADANRFVVVWQDFRNSTLNSAIFGARVDAAGTVLDASGVLLNNAANNQVAPSVAFNGTKFFAAWQDFRSLFTSGDIYGTPINADAVSMTAVVGTGVLISKSSNTQSSPAVAFNGNNTYLVVWSDVRNSVGAAQIYGTRVTGAGGVIDVNGIAIATLANFDHIDPTVTYGGGFFFVAWEDFQLTSGVATTKVFGTRVDESTGAVLPQVDLSSGAGNEAAPSATWDGTRYFVVWGDLRNPTSDIYGQRVTTAGALDGVNFPICSTADTQTDPAVAFSTGAGQSLVVWQDSRGGVFSQRVTTAGALLDGTGTSIGPCGLRCGAPAVASSGTNYLVVWDDHATDNVMGSRVSNTNVVQGAPAFTVTAAADSQAGPAVAFGGPSPGAYFVAWNDHRNLTSMDIYGMRLDANGVVVDPDFAIANSADQETSVALAAGAAPTFLVAYSRYDSSVDLAFRTKGRILTFP
jgi:large repetitive protein